MAYSEVFVSEDAQEVMVEANGGTRRERGAAIAATMRKRGDRQSLRKLWTRYDETYGFQTQTKVRYWKG